ncbi:YxlC family protein [Bacillus sp. FJAT-29790]|uniref:YxlC family protein n=1 Tax=Bacillus sp. FJAT-29790 TaxID=1895002 RepID=UPI001C22FEC4|nr:YxlC family protein [Bacillus sp. FJAT-29790]MBU8880048.1 YxlC family protein [Bacillus sp. FJAT-29790]
MMSRKVNQVDDEHLDKNLLAIVKEIEDGLESVEQHVPVHTPNLEWFENLVVEQKKTLRKRLFMDVALFAVIAMFILSAVLFTLYSTPIVFVAIQGLVAVFIVAYFAIWNGKQVNET